LFFFSFATRKNTQTVKIMLRQQKEKKKLFAQTRLVCAKS